MSLYFAALADACYKSACLPSEKGSAGTAALLRPNLACPDRGTIRRHSSAGCRCSFFGQDEAARGEIRLETTRSASNQNYEACPRGK